jgi:hypothetical protein
MKGIARIQNPTDFLLDGSANRIARKRSGERFGVFFPVDIIPPW